MGGGGSARRPPRGRAATARGVRDHPSPWLGGGSNRTTPTTRGPSRRWSQSLTRTKRYSATSASARPRAGRRQRGQEGGRRGSRHRRPCGPRWGRRRGAAKGRPRRRLGSARRRWRGHQQRGLELLIEGEGAGRGGRANAAARNGPAGPLGRVTEGRRIGRDDPTVPARESGQVAMMRTVMLTIMMATTTPLVPPCRARVTRTCKMRRRRRRTCRRAPRHSVV